MIRTKNAVVNSIDSSILPDGTYTGEYTLGRWANKLAVAVQDHRITAIEVIKDVQFTDTHVIDTIIARVLEKQDCNVAIVTGATVNSKAYMKAIEDALTEKTEACKQVSVRLP